MRPRIVRSPVDICLGTRPSHAAKSRPFAKAAPLPIAATIALAMIGPMPGTVINRRQFSSARARTVAGRSRPSAFAVLRLTTSSYLFGRLDRQFGWLLAPEDAIDVHGCLPELIGGVVPIRGHFFYGSSELLRTDVLLGSFGALNRVRNSQPAPHIINWQAGMSVRMQFSAGAYTSAFDLR